MIQPLLPHSEWLARRRALEKVVSRSVLALRVIAGMMALLLLGLLIFPISLLGLTVALSAIPAVWALAAAALAGSSLRKPSRKDLAMRADKVLGLQDDLLALSELPQGEWRDAAWRQAQQSLSGASRSWPLVFPKRYWLNVLLAVLLTLGATWVARGLKQKETAKAAIVAEARAERIEAAAEIVKDWEEFVKTTDDQELKKLFGEAVQLREAVESNDPMAAMLAMNQIEAKMSAMQENLAAASIAPQAARMAEALEAFEGMGPTSAALRNGNFEAAAKAAEKLGAKLEKDPSGASALRRGDTVAEMLANEAATSQKRGNSALSQTLSKLSSAAAQNCKSGCVPNPQLSQCMSPLKNEFAKEAACKNSGRAVATGKCQIDALRSKLRGEPCEAPPSLCNKPGNKPGGLQAGTGTDGQPLGDPTKLAQAAGAERLAGTVGEGESETSTTAANSGTQGSASAGTKAQLSEYLALSERAVADESLPLAHRRAIRTYFERIRPAAESQSP